MERIGFEVSHIYKNVPWPPPGPNPGYVPDCLVDPPAADQRSVRGASAAGQGGHQKIGGVDYRITRLGNVPDCQTRQCVNVAIKYVGSWLYVFDDIYVPCIVVHRYLLKIYTGGVCEGVPFDRCPLAQIGTSYT